MGEHRAQRAGKHVFELRILNRCVFLSSHASRKGPSEMLNPTNCNTKNKTNRLGAQAKGKKQKGEAWRTVSRGFVVASISRQCGSPDPPGVRRRGGRERAGIAPSVLPLKDFPCHGLGLSLSSFSAPQTTLYPPCSSTLFFLFYFVLRQLLCFVCILFLWWGASSVVLSAFAFRPQEDSNKRDYYEELSFVRGTW